MRAPSIQPAAVSLVALLGLAMACASGKGDDPRGRRDGGPAVDAPGRDVGQPGTDSGPPDTGPPCEDDEVADLCAMADEVGAVMPAGMNVIEGKLPRLSDVDWYHVTFPLAEMGALRGAGMPNIALAGDSTMVMEILSTCTTPVSCGEGVPSEITSWSFVDDQSEMMVTDTGGMGPYMTRDAPWPEDIYIRVSRRGGPADCSDYVLTITR